jgi:CIC family chloride channel protein
MVANTISFLISRRLQHDSLFHIVGHQDGLDLPSVEEQREALPLSVEDAMRTDPGTRVVPSTMRIDDAYERTANLTEPGCLVGIYEKGWFWALRRDMEKTIAAGKGEKNLLRGVTLRAAPRLYPDLSLDSAMRLLATFPILPVVSRANPNQLFGTLTLADVHAAYGILASASSADPERSPAADAS